MCHKIDASFMMIHQLKNKEYCTIYELVEKKHLIENRIPSVSIDVSKNAILSSISNFPEIFIWSDNKIYKKEESHIFFSEPVLSYFDSDIENAIKMEITEILEV
ncbi:MAG: hypothetical protein HC905_02920 [Bacteroidales bacterium]|nr:hypothetical protein [Bacteroidales bacterium]